MCIAELNHALLAFSKAVINNKDVLNASCCEFCILKSPTDFLLRLLPRPSSVPVCARKLCLQPAK